MGRASRTVFMTTALAALTFGLPAFADRDNNDSSGVMGMSSPGFFAASDSLDGYSGDNLGNHKANADLDMGGNAIVDLGEPLDDGDAASKYYVDVKSAAAKDNLGNHVATRVLDMNGNAITGLGDPSTATSGINLRTLEKMIDEIEGDNLGDHKATSNIDMNGHRIEFSGEPESPRDLVTKQYVDGIVTSIDIPADVSGNEIKAGTGLIGGGPLSSDVTLSFSTTWGDGRYALSNRVLTSGDGLEGGGPLTGNLTFKVDGTVVRTSGNQSIAGSKTFSLPVSVPTPTGNGHAATKKYVDDQIIDYKAGSGLSLENGRFALDTTAVRTTGAQTISGTKTFTNAAFINWGTAADAPSLELHPARLHSSTNMQLMAGKDVVVNNYDDAGNLTGATTSRPMVTFIGMSSDPDNPSITLGINKDHPRNRSMGNIIEVFHNEVRFTRDILMRRGGMVGGVPGSNIIMEGGWIKGVGDAVDATDAANLKVVGQQINANAVTLTKNQTVDGAKTFTSVVRAPNFVSTSDARLKDDIKDADFTDQVAKLRPVTFSFKEDGRKSFGFIAQEVEEIFPEAVVTGEDGYKAVDYSIIVSPLVSTVHDLQQQVDELRAEIAALKSERRN